MQTNYFHKILFKKESFKKILIISPNWIGDAILSTPTISVIKRIFPNSSIALLCREKLKDIYTTNNNINNVITYDGKLSNPREMFNISNYLKEQKFNTSIILSNSFKGALIPFLARIPYRMGYNTQLRSILLTNFIEYHPVFRSLHQADYYFKLTGMFGCYEMSDLQLSNSEENLLKAQKFIHDRGISENKKIIVFHPGASKIEKTWHPDRYIKLGKELVDKFDCSIISLGSPMEKDLLEYISHGIGKDAYSCIGFEGIGIHLALIGLASLFIGGDSGYMHVAAALKTKLIAIFGPGAPFHTKPLCNPSKYRIMNRALLCQPCKQHFFKECEPSAFGKPLCLELISPKEIVKAAEELM
jgi:heptosyltransferase II